jgi:arylsulfatase A
MPTPHAFDAAGHRRMHEELDASRLLPAGTASETAPAWQVWREAMNTAVQGRKPRVNVAAGEIRLRARDAVVHGSTLRYEPEPHKNVLGYWTSAEDWASWEFDAPAAGRYAVEIEQGCGAGSGGALVALSVGSDTLAFTVQDTGHFQKTILRDLGTLELAAGKNRLTVRPQSKPGVAVMDLRGVVLRPALENPPPEPRSRKGT